VYEHNEYNLKYEENSYHWRSWFYWFSCSSIVFNKFPDYQIINLDALTYAGNLENLRDIEDKPNYRFVKVNILDVKAVEDLFDQYQVTDVIHLAAESHVDRSIISPLDFVYTNVIGTVNLLDTAKDK
jgi:dTDP-glucose 4,6-dehydratase